MGDSEKYKKMANSGLQVNNYPKDLLQRFIEKSSSSNCMREKNDFESESEELNLGLSMGGKFGVEKKSKNSLVRSCSSIPESLENGDVSISPAGGFMGLARTASLPVEMEDEWRKRKEMQTLRRMEAKRRRSEKQRMLKAAAVDGGGGVGGGEIEVERDQYVSAMKKVGSSVAPRFSLPMLGAPGGRSVFAGEVGGSGHGVQGSVESQGGSTSSMSDLESKPLQGSSNCGEEKEQTNSNTAAGGSSGSKTPLAEPESSSTRSNVSSNIGKETGANSLGDMPCVFTNGDGPNGRRIEGILYRYGKGKEIRIMCVCHGGFHSPAEFIKHAGGTDLANPLKHIVVNPNASYQ